MKRTVVVITGLGVLFLVAMLRTGSADGATMSHASRCATPIMTRVLAGSTGAGGQMAHSDVNGSQLVNATGSDQRVLCPIEETRDPFAIGTVALDGWKATTDGIIAKGCHTFTFGGGGACTPANANTGTGVQNVTIPSSSWHPFHYNYINVVLRPGSVLFGYSHTP